MSRGVHPWRRSELTYCSNVHPGETLAAVIAVLDQHVGAVRALRSLDVMASGLWISAAAAVRLRESAATLTEFCAALARNQIELVTMNGFPYGAFHAAVVKERVYRPDWSDPRRAAYTLDLAEILAACLPAHVTEGTISTLPLGFAPDWEPSRHEAALRQLLAAAGELADLRKRTGRSIRLCLEMEPGCVLDRSDQLIRLFAEELPAAARRSDVEAKAVAQHLGVCFDVCHQAVMFERPAESLQRIADAGIAIGKIQISSALEALDPELASAALEAYVEPRYLHQVRCQRADGTLVGETDLAVALDNRTLPRSSAWRIHFHVPVQVRSLQAGVLETTRDAIEETLDFLANQPDQRPHLEVETYTWELLPEGLRPAVDAELHQGLATELAWLEQALGQRGLLEEAL